MTNKPKFEIHSEALQTALTLVEPFIQSNKSRTFYNPILETVLLETFHQRNAIRITATDLESSCKVFLSAKKIEEDLAIIIPGKSLAKLQKHFDGVVKFRYDPEASKLQARFGKSTTTFKVPGLADEFALPLSEVLDEPVMTFDRAKLRQALEEVLPPAKLAEDNRSDLQNVFFEVKADKNRVHIFSTDGIELSLNVFFPTALEKSDLTFVLHHKSIRKLADALKRIQSKIIEFHFVNDGKMMLFLAPSEAMIYFLTTDAKQPEYEKVMTKEHATHIVVPIDSVRTFLKRALLLEAHLITISHLTDDSFIRFVAETAEVGRTEDSYFAEILGEKKFEIRMCPKRLSGLLKQFKSGNTLILKLKKNAAISSVDIGIKENPATQMLIMPMIV